MIHIALDTSGIGKTKSQKEASYLALKRLIKANGFVAQRFHNYMILKVLIIF